MTIHKTEFNAALSELTVRRIGARRWVLPIFGAGRGADQSRNDRKMSEGRYSVWNCHARFQCGEQRFVAAMLRAIHPQQRKRERRAGTAL